MSIEDITEEDFARTDWQSVIEEADKKTCATFADSFFARARAAGDPATGAVYQLLGDVTSMMFRLENKLLPFKELMRMGDRRSAIPDDITDNQLAVMKEIVPDIQDADLRSRIADLLWVRNRDYLEALRAVDGYLEVAAYLQSIDDAWGMVQRLERALQLAILLRRKSIKDILDQFSEAVSLWASRLQPNVIPIRLMRVLQTYRQGDAEFYSSVAGTEAERAEANGDWLTAGDYWRVKAKWHLILKDTGSQYEAATRAAETSVRLAKQMAGSPEGFLAGAEHLTSAIEALRQIPGTQQRIAELHPLLLDYQKRATAAMKKMSHEMDISKFVEKARADVAGKDFLCALRSLAFISNPSDVTSLRRQVEELSRNSIQALIPNTRLNAEGRRVGRTPAVHTDDLDEREVAIRAEMFMNAARLQDLMAAAYVDPAIHQITLEHDIRIDDLLPIVSDNPLVPPGREPIYAKGLFAGLCGDFLEATHILIPQLENSLRYLLYQTGSIASGLDSHGIQDEHDLNRILYMPQVKQMLGESITFDLQGLLVERFGTNFRNNMAHGLYEYGAFMSGRATYVWWIVLHLCFLFRLVPLQQSPDVHAPGVASDISVDDTNLASTGSS